MQHLERIIEAKKYVIEDKKKTKSSCRWFACSSKKKTLEEPKAKRTSEANPLDEDKKTIILFLEGCFMYSTLSKSKDHKKKLMVIKSFKDKNLSVKVQEKKGSSKLSENALRLREVPLVLKKDSPVIDISLRPYSIEFVDQLAYRYNIVLVSKSKIHVSMILWVLVKECP